MKEHEANVLGLPSSSSLTLMFLHAAMIHTCLLQPSHSYLQLLFISSILDSTEERVCHVEFSVLCRLSPLLGLGVLLSFVLFIQNGSIKASLAHVDILKLRLFNLK